MARTYQTKLIRAGRMLAEKRLVWGKSGNISLKTDENRFLISAAGTNLEDLTPDDIISCHLEQDVWEGKKRPSMETGMHRGIYQACPEATAVVHTQAVYSTIVACSNLKIRTDLLPETMAYLGVVQRVSYFHAGSSELAEAAASQAQSGSVLLLDNHGALCWGTSLDVAVLKAETLEFLSALIVKSHKDAIELNSLGDSVLKEFQSHLKKIGS